MHSCACDPRVIAVLESHRWPGYPAVGHHALTCEVQLPQLLHAATSTDTSDHRRPLCVTVLPAARCFSLHILVFFLSLRRKRQSGGSDEPVINPNGWEKAKKKSSQQMGHRFLQILQFEPCRQVAAVPPTAKALRTNAEANCVD